MHELLKVLRMHISVAVLNPESIMKFTLRPSEMRTDLGAYGHIHDRLVKVELSTV